MSFVATEWGAPNYSALCDDPRVFLVTCIREPWSRLISNFNYDYYLGYADSSTLTGYFNEEHRIKRVVHMMDSSYMNVQSSNPFLVMEDTSAALVV